MGFTMHQKKTSVPPRKKIRITTFKPKQKRLLKKAISQPYETLTFLPAWITDI